MIRILLVAALAPMLCAGDKGGLPFKQVDVTEPNQMALIAHDGTTEVLYISSILRAKEKVKILEILPLPSEPKAELADPKVIERAAGLYNAKVRAKLNRELMRKIAMIVLFFAVPIALIVFFIRAMRRAYQARRHVLAALWVAGLAMTLFVWVAFNLTGSLSAELRPSSVEVISQQQLGPHGLTIVKANDPKDIVTYIEQFINRERGDAAAFDAGWRSILETYVKDGYPYFALDVIEADPASGPVAPIRYTFASPSLYFPLRISSRGKGPTDIALFVVTPQDPRWHGSYYHMKMDWAAWHHPFEVDSDELAAIDPVLTPLFEKRSCWIRCARFKWNLEDLKHDFVVSMRP